jgi:hypothetical protein
MSTWEEAQRNHLRISKWTNYFWVYDRYLGPWRGKPVRLLEIGVQQGGSLELWRRYLGDEATVVGLDHEPRFAFKAPGIFSLTGDAADPHVLRALVRDFGPFDIVIDDGSKIQREVRAAFEVLYPSLTENGVYIAEDEYASFIPTAHSQQLGGDWNHPPFLDFAYRCAKELTEYQAYRWSGMPTSWNRRTWHTEHTRAISFYDSMVVFERGEMTPGKAWEFGELRAPA